MRTILLALLLAACSMDRSAEVPEVQSHGTVTQQYLDNAPQRVDILFVIDSSPAMAAVEDRVRAANSDVATVAEGRLAGPRSDLHVGVITADPNDGGILRRTALFDGAYLIDRKTTAASHNNYPGSFAPALLDLTDVGMTGSPDSQPLESLRTALAGNAHNDGFLRPDAKLAIVILTAQDDASPGELADYAAFLRGLKTDEDDVMIAVAGTDASCGGAANPRLQSFAGTRFTTLCDGDLSYFVFTNACVPDNTGSFPSPCLYGDLLDTDPATPGIQADCQASDLGGAYGACDAGNPTPCWRATPNENMCGDDLQFTVDRGDADPPSTQNLVTVECVTR